jgi:UDP-glucose 4-epimerase
MTTNSHDMPREEKKNWLVTGGCGFIGRNLIRRLTAQGKNVLVVDDFSAADIKDLLSVAQAELIDRDELTGDWPGGTDVVRVLRASVLEEETALAVAEGADAMVHLAANTGVPASIEDPRRDCHVNVVGTQNYLEAARRHGIKFVFASSSAPLGDQEPPIHEELPSHPRSPYGASKAAGEAYCSAYFHGFGVETVALRFGNVYGPYSAHKSSVVAEFNRRVLAGEPLRVEGNGQQTRDFIHVDDLVRAITSAAETPAVGGELFQIATAHETSILELLDLLRSIWREDGVKVSIERAPERPGDIFRNYSDTSKARRLLGWQSETDLRTGLKTTWRWFLQARGAGGRT